MTINIFNTEHELLSAITKYFIEIAKKSIKEHEVFNVVLSGGNSPKKLYKLLSAAEYKNQIDWSKINFFFGDERYVPEDDEKRNSLMVQKFLFEPLKIPPTQVFKVDTTFSPDEAARKYNETINAQFKFKSVHFDLTLLGLGGNSHTASLFPFTPVLHENAATVKSVYLKEQNTHRITLTAPMINQSKHIAFLVYGKEKAEAVHHVLKDKHNIEKYPAQLINPREGELKWFLDEAAASLLDS